MVCQSCLPAKAEKSRALARSCRSHSTQCVPAGTVLTASSADQQVTVLMRLIRYMCGGLQHFAGYDPEGFSVWWSDYKYDDENTVNYQVMNKVGGFLQRIDYVRKYAFGVMCILKNDKGEFPIRYAPSSTTTHRGHPTIPPCMQALHGLSSFLVFLFGQLCISLQPVLHTWPLSGLSRVQVVIHSLDGTLCLNTLALSLLIPQAYICLDCIQWDVLSASTMLYQDIMCLALSQSCWWFQLDSVQPAEHCLMS